MQFMLFVQNFRMYMYASTRQLINFLESNELLLVLQSRFRKGVNTTTALLDVVKFIDCTGYWRSYLVKFVRFFPDI